ncbi:cof family had hydrolase protein [Mycoplasmopsis columbina SF7]|uniref:Cof family had hydrolase protein n=1 Tax=Mycoplasmopsis columbina SF7 TaxID=1037410 RepID=F9UKJ8_9BACT|nr:Cof-type HAD-IIB family hydrolase [Mycoplasmopsis columbina]EGV00203.1 cof family had hydrolase protein [Mycoplasmopsis columbina SF7]
MKKIEKKPKLIFIDLDGTTLDIKKDKTSSVSDENIKAIRECREKGIEVVISTGRGELKKTYDINSKLGLPNSIIFWNGSKIIKDQKVIFEKAIDQNVMTEIFELAAKEKMTVILNSDFKNGSYSTCLFFKAGAFLKGAKAKHHSEYKTNEKIYKVIFWNIKKEKVANFYDLLNKKYKDFLTISFAGEKNNFLEVTSKGCSKGEAEKIYAQYQGINLEDCMHFGDSMNDASTIGIVGTVVAMANSVEEYKNKANIISKYAYKNGGLAKTLGELILNHD